MLHDRLESECSRRELDCQPFHKVEGSVGGLTRAESRIRVLQAGAISLSSLGMRGCLESSSEADCDISFNVYEMGAKRGYRSTL